MRSVLTFLWTVETNQIELNREANLASRGVRRPSSLLPKHTDGRKA
jgi:hypothetical protein